MPHPLLRLVLDTNTVLQGLILSDSAAGRLLSAVETRLMLVIISKPLVTEYRDILTDPEIKVRFPGLSTQLVETTLFRLRYIGEYISNPQVRFEFQRDPRDAKLIELAIAGAASYIISFDQDLLSLPTARSNAGRRFRQRLSRCHVLTPAEFLRRYAQSLGIKWTPDKPR